MKPGLHHEELVLACPQGRINPGQEPTQSLGLSLSGRCLSLLALHQAPQPRFLTAATASLDTCQSNTLSPPTLQCGPQHGVCGAWGQGEGWERQRGLAPEAALSGASEINTSSCRGDRSDLVCGQHKPRTHMDPTCFSTHTWLCPQPFHHQPQALMTLTTASIKSSSLTRGAGNTVSIGKHPRKDTLSRPQ